MNVLPIAQIIVSILLITLILLQQRGQALGSLFGGGGGSEAYGTLRGAQKKIFMITCVLGGLFILLALLNLLL